MFWIIPLVAVGAAALVAGLNSMASAERERFDEAQVKLREDVVRARKSIERKLQDHGEEWNFRVLCQHHYLAFRLADQAHGLFLDARKSLRAIGKTIGQSRVERDEARARLRRCRSKAKRGEIQRELEGYDILRKRLFADRDQLKGDMDGLAEEVRRLNQRSRQLKELIRDRCGDGGQIWYQRLERRVGRKRRKKLRKAV